MPVSSRTGKKWAVPLYTNLAPKRVADVGAGAGTWASTLRPHHSGHWTAIEAWKPYVSKYRLHEKYDEVIVGSVTDHASLLWDADLVIFGDVLEHIREDIAEVLVKEVRDTGVGLLVAGPVTHMPQGAVHGNPYEEHLWHPTHAQMMAMVQPDKWHVRKNSRVAAYWRYPRPNGVYA